MPFGQGARAAVGPRLFTLARRGAIGGTSGSRPPREYYVQTEPKVTIGGWRWGTWWEMSQGTRGTMTGAHLGGRGACRRRSCSATAAPREGGRRRGHGDGRHHPRPQRSFFSPNSDRRVTFFQLPKLCSWTSPTASKAALAAVQTKTQRKTQGPWPACGQPWEPKLLAKRRTVKGYM